jgi:hypothetical protein
LLIAVFAGSHKYLRIPSLSLKVRNCDLSLDIYDYCSDLPVGYPKDLSFDFNVLQRYRVRLVCKDSILHLRRLASFMSPLFKTQYYALHSNPLYQEQRTYQDVNLEFARQFGLFPLGLK